jgi:hypothetical protein
MSLPKLDKPVFSILIPSKNIEAYFRPFTVKEEKILLIGQQSEKERDIITAIKQVIQNCHQGKDSFDVEKLATFDLEYLFLKLRSLSVNNVITVSYKDNEDEKIYDFQIDLDDVIVRNADKIISNKIAITDTVGIIMTYPSVKVLEDTPEDSTLTELTEYLIRSCIESIYDETLVYPASDYTTEELEEWLDDLSVEAFEKIKDFFDNIPQMYYKIEYKNSLGTERKIELTTLNDFFTWR